MASMRKQQTNLEWMQSLDADGYLRVFGQGAFCDLVKGECTGDCDKCLHEWFGLPYEEKSDICSVDGYHASCVIFDELHPQPLQLPLLPPEENPFEFKEDA